MTNQPEALRLSETLLDYELSQDYVIATIEAAAELRRLHEQNESLIAANKDSMDHFNALMADYKKVNDANQELVEALKLMFLEFNRYGINESEAHALITAFELIVKAG